jgi:hypothetical protein
MNKNNKPTEICLPWNKMCLQLPCLSFILEHGASCSVPELPSSFPPLPPRLCWTSLFHLNSSPVLAVCLFVSPRLVLNSQSSYLPVGLFLVCEMVTLFSKSGLFLNKLYLEQCPSPHPFNLTTPPPFSSTFLSVLYR